MTRVVMLYNNNIPVGFKMEGHAGYNPEGPDILCASLSAISQMTANGILYWLGIDYDEVVRSCNAKLGELHVQVPEEFEHNITAQQFLTAFEMHTKSLSEIYYEYITIGRRDVNDNES